MDLAQYNVQLLPKKLRKTLVRKFAALYLDAIRAINPRILEHAPEFTRTLESWEEQLCKPNYWAYVLIASNIQTGDTSIDNGQWVGILILEGPLDVETYSTFDQIRPSRNAYQTLWHGGKFYITEKHRNMDVFQLFTQAATSHIERITRQNFNELSGQKVFARLQYTAYHGSTVHAYYSTNGSRPVAQLTREEDLKDSGILETMPREFRDGDETKLVSTLFEYVMEFTIVVGSSSTE